MDVNQRIEAIRRMLAPMVEQGLITVEQEENCERMLVNLAEHTAGDSPDGRRHHGYFTHKVLVDAVFNGCSREAQAYAMGLNVERIAFEPE